MRKTLVLLSATFLVVFSASAYAMTITPMTTADALAQTLVGPGVTISNVTYTGANVASGTFTGGATAGIGIESGIVLTSGFASNLNGTANTSDAITGANSLPGAAMLNALVPGYTTYDATILEFDFVSAGDAAYFNYVFGSDEYNEYTNTSFNDVFGFFFDGTAVGDNVALLPDGTAVSINNVNGGNPFGANATNPGLYNNNDPNDPMAVYPFEYDGFTDVLTASMTGLTAGATYHIALAIADSGDYILDSGVFLEAGSFSNIPTGPVPEPATMLLLGSGVIGMIGFKKRRNSAKPKL